MSYDSKDSKKGFALLLGAPKGSDGPEVDHKSDLGLDGKGAEDSAIKDFIGAVKAGDSQGASNALKDFLEICYPKLSDDEPNEGSTEEEASDQTEE